MKQTWKTEIPAVATALVVLATCLVLLWRDSHAADDGGRKVGSITYRFRIAQGRDGGSVVWRDLDLNSAVYNNNYVRTDAASEAVVTLNDRTRIELEPDSMIVLQVSDKRIKVRLDRGSVLLKKTKPGNKPLVVGAPNGREFEVPFGSLPARVDGDGKQVRLAPRAGLPVPLEPPDNLRLFTRDAQVPVKFSWREKGEVVLEISSSRSMASVTRRRSSNTGSATLSFPSGFHYWRIRVAGKTSAPRRIRVVKRTALVLDGPDDGRTFTYSVRPPLVGFAWTADRLALSYVVRVGRNPALDGETTTIRAYRTGISRAFPAGTYYWRVETEGVLPGSETRSPVRRFIVRESSASSRPKLIAPGGDLELAVVKKEGVLFRWRAGSDIQRALLSVSKGSADAKPLLTSEVRDNHHRMGKNLTAGTYYWRIQVRGGKESVTSKVGLFRVVVGKPSPPKPVQPAAKPAVKIYLSRPRVIFPRPRSVVDMSTRDFIDFRWRAVPGAVGYGFTLYHRGRVIYRRSTRRPRLRFTDLSKLDTGRFAWRIIAKPSTKSGKTASRSSASFRITLSDGPDKPSFKK